VRSNASWELQITGVIWEQVAAQALGEGPAGEYGHNRALLALIEASKNTDLRRFFPFSRMHRLCFARTSIYPFEDIQAALIEYREGHYTVRSGGRYPVDHDPPIALEATAPAFAVAEALRLLQVSESN